MLLLSVKRLCGLKDLSYNGSMDASAAEKAYKPDREGRKEPVVVGLSGGVKSYVTASLLKIQKYEVIGVTVQNEPQGFQASLDKVVRCHASDQKLDEIRLFCRSLGIPHFVVKSGAEFQETVVETWKSSRIQGTLARQCRLCHVMRLRILHREMLRLGVHKLATGHLGKIFVQNESIFLRSSNDEKHDQSGLLSELPEPILRSLLLPLSDLQYAEILRLAENFAIMNNSHELTSCFPASDPVNEFLEKTIPPGIRKLGSLVIKDEDKFDDHEGVQNYIYGEPISPKDSHDEHVFIDYKASAKEIILGTSADFLTDDFFIACDNISDTTALTEPSTGYVRLKDGEVECWLSPKNLGRIHVKLSEKKRILTGSTLSLFRRPGRNSKLIVTGRVTGAIRVEDEADESSEEKLPTQTQYSR